MSATSAIVDAAVAATAGTVQLTKQANPYTPTFWAIVGSISVQIMVLIGIGIKGLPAITKANSDADVAKAKIVTDNDVAFKEALMREMTALRGRITDLEKSVVDERRACDERIAQIEKRHDQETAHLHGELKGMRDNFHQQSRSQGNLIGLGVNAPIATARLMDE